jgi:predicted RNase H-like HicB family nuclease
MKTYIAFFECIKGKNGKNGYSVVFPDFPGLVTAGNSYEETYKLAHEGLASHINFLEKKDVSIPEPRTMEQIENTWEEWKDWKTSHNYMVVPINRLPIVTKSKRINIFINEELLAKIDMVAKNRSEYISQAINHFIFKEQKHEN